MRHITCSIVTSINDRLINKHCSSVEKLGAPDWAYCIDIQCESDS